MHDLHCPYFARKVMVKLKRMRGHFVTLTEICVHLIESNPKQFSPQLSFNTWAFQSSLQTPNSTGFDSTVFSLSVCMLVNLLSKFLTYFNNEIVSPNSWFTNYKTCKIVEIAIGIQTTQAETFLSNEKRPKLRGLPLANKIVFLKPLLW